MESYENDKLNHESARSRRKACKGVKKVPLVRVPRLPKLNPIILNIIAGTCGVCHLLAILIFCVESNVSTQLQRHDIFQKLLVGVVVQYMNSIVNIYFR